MPSSLFPMAPKGSGIGANPVRNTIGMLKSMLGGDPQQLYAQMYNTNPQFRQFADSMQGKTPEQAFSENGYDYEQIRRML